MTKSSKLKVKVPPGRRMKIDCVFVLFLRNPNKNPSVGTHFSPSLSSSQIACLKKNKGLGWNEIQDINTLNRV